MLEWKIQTPVILIAFNRPDSTRQVFEAIRKARPPQLFLVADGPRPAHPSDLANCAQVRDIIAQVDWDCDVRQNYVETNLGCKRRVSSGLKWAFEQTETAIILEDDCLPHPSFFRFAQELLEKYKDDERVFSISGNNFQFGRHLTPYSYYFSRYPHIWGWATWRRSLVDFDPDIPQWPEIRATNGLANLFETQVEINYWRNVFDRVCAGKVDSWGYGLLFHTLVQHRLNILPTVNLVTNIGFSNQATHTRQKRRQLSYIPAVEMPFPLKHPGFMLRHRLADDYTRNEHYHASKFYERIVRKIRFIVGSGTFKQNHD